MAPPTNIPEPFQPAGLSEPGAPLRRVVVTGLGAVTALGASLAATRAAFERGERAAGRSVPGAPHLTAAAAAAFDERAAFRYPKALKLADRKVRLAVAAAVEAVADAGLADDTERENWGVVLGCSASTLQVEEIAHALAIRLDGEPEAGVSRFAGRLLSGLHPLWLLVNLPNMIGAHVGIQLEASGPNQTVTGDTIAGAQAIGEAWLAVALGECDVAIAGGAESPLDPFDLGCFAVDPTPRCLAEGAAILILEARERALARGVRIYATIEGYGSGPAESAALRLAGAAGSSPVAAEALRERLGDTVAASGALAAALALAEGERQRSSTLLPVTARGLLGQATTILFRSAAAVAVPAA